VPRIERQILPSLYKFGLKLRRKLEE